MDKVAGFDNLYYVLIQYMNKLSEYLFLSKPAVGKLLDFVTLRHHILCYDHL
jgi:hypothetical protein